MPSGDRRSPLERIRQHARARVEQTSIRHVAAEVGMDFSAMRRFLNGATPYTENRKKLEDWERAGPDEVERLRARVAELERMLEECEAKLKRSK